MDGWMLPQSPPELTHYSDSQTPQLGPVVLSLTLDQTLNRKHNLASTLQSCLCISNQKNLLFFNLSLLQRDINTCARISMTLWWN